MTRPEVTKSRAATAAFFLFAAALALGLALGATSAEAALPRSVDATALNVAVRDTDSLDGEASAAILHGAVAARVDDDALDHAPDDTPRLGFAEELCLLEPDHGQAGFAIFRQETCRCERTYARNNPLRYTDPFGLSPDEPSAPEPCTSDTEDCKEIPPQEADVTVTAQAPSDEEFRPLPMIDPGFVSAEYRTREDQAREILGGVYRLSKKPVEYLGWGALGVNGAFLGATATIPAGISATGTGLFQGAQPLITVGGADVTAYYLAKLASQGRLDVLRELPLRLLDTVGRPVAWRFPGFVGLEFIRNGKLWSVVYNPTTLQVWHLGGGPLK